MMQNRRYFATILKKSGKLQLVAFFFTKERKEYCDIKENHARPKTMEQWKKFPKDMKV